MTWFVFSIICILGWGLADLFYKKSACENEKYSYLKTTVWVGIVMGICSLLFLLFTNSNFTAKFFINSLIKYLPASLSYIISMIIGYAGLRYLEVSIISPIQNASGGLSAICIIIYMLLIGQIASIGDELTVLDIVGTILIVLGVISLAIVQKKIEDSKENTNSEKKYKIGVLALMFPILYCVFDTIGTAADGIILNENSGIMLEETDVNIIYGFTFFFFGLLSWIYVSIKEKKVYNPFSKNEGSKCIAACCEEFGQIFYIYAMANNPVLAAPTVASYCIISIILSRIFLKEKLKINQYICIITVVIGIVILGISEGINSF